MQSALVFIEPSEPAVTRPLIHIVQCRGVVVGEGEQWNWFEFEIEQPVVDMAELMGRPDVARALHAFAEDPTDPEVVQRAEDALGRGRFLFRRNWMECEDELETVRSEGGSGGWDSAIVVVGSRGVCIGAHVHQENRFEHVLRPRINAVDLFAAFPELARATLEHMAGAAAAEVGRLWRAVDSEVAHQLERSTAERDDLGVFRDWPERGEAIEAVGVEGLGIGWVQQHNRTSFDLVREPTAVDLDELFQQYGIEAESPAHRRSPEQVPPGPEIGM